MKALSEPLRIWHKQYFGDMTKRIKKFEEEIRKVDDMVSSRRYDGTIESRRRALVRYCEKWHIRQDLLWKQMSRSRHATEMDRNTRYFYNIASARRRNNRIEALVINGRLVRNQARIKIVIRDFYKRLYHQEASCIPKGSDGYNMNFLKKCWNEIRTEFTVAVMKFFETTTLPTDANVTWVALAPKFVGAKEIKYLRPISMVGCTYKVISKLLTRRMRSVMPSLVGESQSAFVKGRKIYDRSLIACETV
ncbi:uncharacterized protein [Arachis hypogaea]|uniref:uncharacterized protein n=1 Tax=Arachis hypogaea TaxID=3818 RepID=UPI003B219B59